MTINPHPEGDGIYMHMTVKLSSDRMLLNFGIFCFSKRMQQ
jgi:hypothetical protein